MSIRTKRGIVAATIGLALVATPLALTTGAVGAETSTTRVAKAKANTFDLQILSFNDFHGHLEATDDPVSSLPDECNPEEPVEGCTPPVGGIEYLAGHVRDLREKQPNRTLTVAAGDLIGGSTFLSGLFQDQPSIEAMNALQLDVSSVGNHEFDEGTAELKRMIKGGCHPEKGCFKDLDGQDIEYDGTDFPYLGANVVRKSDGKPFLRSRAIKTIKGKKIGFIGMTLQGTPLLVNPSGIDTVKFKDEVRTARKNVRILKNKGVKAIVVLVHEGGYQEAGISGCKNASGPIMDIADRMPAAVDAIISGHTHAPYVCKIADPQGKKRLVTSAASFGQVLTEMHLKINRRTGEVARGERRHFVEVTLRVRLRARGELVQEIENLLRRVRHLRRKGVLRIASETQQPRHVSSQLQDFSDERRVIPFGLAELCGTRDVFAIHELPQAPVVRILQNRDVGRRMQRELPAFAAIGLRGFARRFEHIGGNAGKRRGIGDVMGERIRSVQQVVAEARRKLRQALAYRHEARLVGLIQLGTPEPEIAELVFDDALLRRRKRLEFR